MVSITGLHGLISTIVTGHKPGEINVPDYYSPTDYGKAESGASLSTGGAFQKLWIATTKYKPEAKSVKIIGAQDVSLSEITYKASDGTDRAVNALTQETFDITTYPDRAILKLKNERGFDVYLRAIALNGNLIYQYSGANGELLHDGLRNDDDIRRNGERCLEIGNKFVVDGTQCAKIADYWWKKAGKKKHVYSLTIPGVSWWYEPGEWYTFALGEAGTNEYIDATVECYSVDVERVAGGIGSTNVLFRDVEDSWSKTTLYATRLVSGGSPKRRVNRSNIVTVASSTYDGTYDYRCDGTDDDVQIQAAIDYVYNTFGGGKVILTDGTFKVTAAVELYSNIVFEGQGASSIIERDGDVRAINAIGISGTELENIIISNIYCTDKNGNTYNGSLYYLSYVKNSTLNKCTAYNSYGNGINIGDSQDIIVIDCISDANGNNTIGTSGILIFDSNNVNVSKSVVKNNYDYGIALSDNTEIYIDSCNIENNDYGGIVILGGSTIRISNNTIDTHIYGIVDNTGNVVSNSTIANNRINNTLVGHGIFIQGNNNSITGNVITNGTGHGISISGTDITISGNNIDTNGNSNTDYGILISGERCVINANVITNNYYTGIYLGANDCTITNNTVYANGGNGIFVNTLIDNTVISGNTVNGNTLVGIFINAASCDRTVVTGNRSTGNTSSNYTDNGTNTTSTGNDFN